jgi:three-Cys-motif partner protein
VTRAWNYWTRNKLTILQDYLPAFNRAAKNKAPTRVYIDLMAGQPENVDRDTGESFDGSARLAMQADPGFQHLAFIERDPANAEALRLDLEARFPGDTRGRVYIGDCNVVIDQVLSDLAGYRWSPTFAFIDQQAAEVRWSTLRKLAAFRRGKRKTEMWILMSPAMVAKGAKGTNSDSFAARVDDLYGNADWRKILKARDEGLIDAEAFRTEMVNLFRWQAERDLGYTYTARIPMKMPNNVTIYDMVFCTDHPVGDTIMTWLYQKAAEREPLMQDELRLKRLNEAGADSLFDLTPDMLATSSEPVRWVPTPTWDPRQAAWWN